MLFSFFLLVGLLPMSFPEDAGRVPDSLLTEDHVYELMFKDLDSARFLLEEMRKRELFPAYELDMYEGDLLYNNGRYSEALPYYQATMEADCVRLVPSRYMDILHRLVSCYDCLSDEKEALEHVELLLSEARKCGDKAMESVALFNLGKMAYYEEDKKKGYGLMLDAVRIMEESRYLYKYDNLRYNYNTLLVLQQKDGLWDEALKTLGRLEKVVTAGMGGEPDIDGLAEKELKTLYAQEAIVYWNKGMPEEARRSYEKWKNTAVDYTRDDYLIAPYLYKTGQYEENLRIYKEREAALRAGGDTVSYHMRGVKRALAVTSMATGDFYEAALYFEQLAILNDSLKVQEQRHSALELATLYETHKYELEVEAAENKARLHAYAFYMALATLFLLLVFLFVQSGYMRKISRKNRKLSVFIQELQEYKEELARVQERLEREHQEKESGNGLACPSGVPGGEDEGLDCRQGTGSAKPQDGEEGLRDTRLFEEMDRRVEGQKLYLNPDFSRADLMKLIHVDKNRLAKMMRQQSIPNVVAYINEKRLEHAVRLMRQYPAWKLSVIAEGCGIPNVSTFNRLFKQAYGMTPSEFKKSMMEERSVKDGKETGLTSR